MATHEQKQQMTPNIQSTADILESNFYIMPGNACLELLEGFIKQISKLSPEQKNHLRQRIEELKRAGQENYQKPSDKN